MGIRMTKTKTIHVTQTRNVKRSPNIMTVVTGSSDQASWKQPAPTISLQTTDTEEGDQNERLYQCQNGGNPQVVQWYIDLGDRHGQWFLSLRDGQWVFQPAQYDHNKFLFYLYIGKLKTEPAGIPCIQLQSVKYSPSEETCIEITPTAHLTTTDLPESMIGKTWISVNPRFFTAIPTLQSGVGWVLESLDEPGYCLAYDPKSIQPTSKFTSAILVKKGDPNWDKRFIYPIDSGKLDGTQEFIFLPSPTDSK
ncbi:uncharacterized protein [Amphiura filiformis]|uniref:uncharacterized protein n=1 Tax=Amphiura filiformis TaxID=82378 RepID=UPI003B21A2F0